MTSDSIPPSLIAATETDEPVASRGALGGPGRVIRVARERARLSIEELAIQTKLARSTLEALERDDFDALNEAVYVRGYYRKCAKVLGLVESDLLTSYEMLVVPKAPQAPTKLLIGSGPAMGRPSLRRRGNAGRTVAIVVVAAVVSALVWFLLNQPSVFSSLRAAPPASAVRGSASVPTAGAVSESRPASELAAPAATTSDAEPGSNEAVVESASTHGAAPSVAAPAPAPIVAAPAASTTPPNTVPGPAQPSAAASTLTSAPAAASSVATPPGDLTLNFKSTSWIRVEDADGKLLLSGVVQAGDRQQLRGRTPYSLFVGNAPAVVIEYGGKVIDTAPFVKSNSTARLTIP